MEIQVGDRDCDLGCNRFQDLFVLAAERGRRETLHTDEPQTTSASDNRNVNTGTDHRMNLAARIHLSHIGNDIRTSVFDHPPTDRSLFDRSRVSLGRDTVLREDRPDRHASQYQAQTLFEPDGAIVVVHVTRQTCDGHPA